MSPMIPEEKWQPLSVQDVCDLFDGAPFQWAIAGGYAIELFLGESHRSHEDTDVLVFRDEQLTAQAWLKDWTIYASDPPGTLRLWEDKEYLPSGINDIWLHHQTSDAWQLQLLLTDVDGADWIHRHYPTIRGKRDALITRYGGIPCIRVEVQLFYKARKRRPKDEQDFRASLPHLSQDAKTWLKDNLSLIYSEGHDWLEFLT